LRKFLTHIYAVLAPQAAAHAGLIDTIRPLGNDSFQALFLDEGDPPPLALATPRLRQEAFGIRYARGSKITGIKAGEYGKVVSAI
jgi:hypothetical protein